MAAPSRRRLHTGAIRAYVLFFDCLSKHLPLPMTGSDEDSYGRGENLHCGDLDANLQ
jgi:hypothetical protein